MVHDSVFTALQSISTPLHVYQQAATGSQEFQDPCTWYMQSNSVFTVQALQSISIPFRCIQTSCNEFSGIPRSLHMVHAKQFCLYSAAITIYIYSFTYIQTSCNRFSGIPRSLHMVHAKQFCLYSAGIKIYIYLLYMYTNKLQRVLRNSKIPAHGSCKTILSLLCRHYNLYLSPLHVYKQAATGSQEFQDTCMHINGYHAKQFCLYSAGITIYIYSLYMYTNKLQQVLRSSKIPAHGPLNVILCTTQMQQVLRKVKTPDVVQPCKATLRVPRTCPGHQKEGHGSIPLE